MFHLPRLRITRPYRTSVALEEERLWVGFYRRVDNPAIAAEVIKQLDGDADQKRTHPALGEKCRAQHFLPNVDGSNMWSNGRGSERARPGPRP